MNKLTQQKGFSIIEVVLVLAIAGLIFLMVFIALPALQRNQRDSAKQTEVGTVVSAIGTYMGANNGKLPTTPGSVTRIITESDSGELESGTKVVMLNNAETVAEGDTDSNVNVDTIVIVRERKCPAETGTGDSITLTRGSKRQAAVVAYLESGSFYCKNA